MADRLFDAIMWVREPPRITYEEGMFHVGYYTGKIHAEFVMAPRVYFAALADAVEVSRKHKSGVVRLADHAASASGKPSK